MLTEKKLKIIHTEASPHWGGQEIRIFEEMKWFREQGHEMILVAPNNGTLYQRSRDKGFEVISIYFTKPRILLNILKMLWLAWWKKPDVVATHSSTDSWAGLIAAKILGIKKCVRYRHVSTPVKENLLNKWQYKILSNLVITTGECISKPLTKSFLLPENKVITIPTPISPPFQMMGREEAKVMLQRKFRVDSDTRFIGQVSVLRSWKGHSFLIEAFNEIADYIPKLNLVLVGSGPIEEKLKTLVLKSEFSERIQLVGHKENPWPYFRAFEITVLASTKNEGIPQSLLQSMYAQTPVIGTNTGGIPEIICNSSTGLICNKADSQTLAKAILRLLRNHRLQEEFSKNAHDFVIEKFNWNELGLQIEKKFMR